MTATPAPLSFRVKLGLGLLLAVSIGVPALYPWLQTKKTERMNTLRAPLISIDEVKRDPAVAGTILATVCNRNADATLTRLRVVFTQVPAEQRATSAIEAHLDSPMEASSCRVVAFALPAGASADEAPQATAWAALWDKDVPEQWDSFIPLTKP